MPDHGGVPVIIILDQNGRVYQMEGGTIRGANFRQIKSARTALLDLMDRLDVQDYPAEPLKENDHG